MFLEFTYADDTLYCHKQKRGLTSLIRRVSIGASTHSIGRALRLYGSYGKYSNTRTLRASGICGMLGMDQRRHGYGLGEIAQVLSRMADVGSDVDGLVIKDCAVEVGLHLLQFVPCTRGTHSRAYVDFWAFAPFLEAHSEHFCHDRPTLIGRENPNSPREVVKWINMEANRLTTVLASVELIPSCSANA